MEREVAGWSRGRWEPSAPESFVLLYGPDAQGRQALKLALLELVASGRLALRSVEEGGFFGNRSVAVLHRGSGRGAGQRPLRALLEAFDAEAAKGRRADGGVTVKRLAENVGRRYGSSGQYVQREVLPALGERGLYERQQKRFAGLIPYTGWGPTAAGEAARARLRREMDLGESGFGEWVDRDPNRALAYLGLMGPAILLMTPLHPDIQRLREQNAATGSSGDGGGTYSSDPAPDEHAPEGPETEGLDFGGGDFGSSEFAGGGFDASALDSGFDLSAFDGIGDAFSAIDAGVDAGGGGDGGGGDGGGGGD